MSTPITQFTTDQLQKFVDLARLAKAIYPGPTNHRLYRIHGARFKRQKYVYGTAWRGFCRVWWNDDDVVLVFRGTRELLFDFFCTNLLAWPWRPPVKSASPCLVHWGFRYALQFTDRRSRKPALETMASLLEPLLDSRRILITGHSLGGALAVLAAYSLSDRLRSRPEVVTFGAPGVGDHRFAGLYPYHNDTYQFVHGADPVPHTPPFFYRQVGQTLRLGDRAIPGQPTGEQSAHQQPRPGLLRALSDHRIDNYIDALSSSLAMSVR